jgi:hypothetical protein
MLTLSSTLNNEASIKFYLLIGQLNKALLQINEAIQKYPENLEIRLLWINIVIKMQKENEVHKFLLTAIYCDKPYRL